MVLTSECPNSSCTSFGAAPFARRLLYRCVAAGENEILQIHPVSEQSSYKNYYREVKDKNRVYYEFYHLDGTENVPEDYKEISFVCLRPDGSLELPSTLGTICRKIAQKLDGFEGFHFHQLRHTYTSNLLANGAAPKDVQELLGHSDVSTTMNVYAHSTRKAKRESARLLDKVAGND